MDNNEEEDSKIFPQKLMEILGDPDPLVQESICWLPHGKAFIIRNRAQFEKHIMPRFFHRKAKYSSFTRKLNRWYVLSSLFLPNIDDERNFSRRHAVAVPGISLAFRLDQSLEHITTNFFEWTDHIWLPKCFARIPERCWP